MAALSLEQAIESALESFPNIDCLKDEQKKCIAALLQKKDVLGLLPAGFGKSLNGLLFDNYEFCKMSSPPPHNSTNSFAASILWHVRKDISISKAG